MVKWAMRFTQALIPTLKEQPAEAVLASHALMIRAGMIRKLGSGLYSYLPYGLKALKKVEQVIREEMNKSGALEFSFPLLLPKELLVPTGRWQIFKRELFRLKDRNDADFALGPTHEEAFAAFAAAEISSHKQLPLNLYQIGPKFRDEIRPRFGVMRSKEFIMKDAYSFHVDDASLDATYKVMSETYQRIFSRLGLDFVHVKADSGAMGGSGSEEFMVKSQVGEEAILTAPGYAANIETAQEDEAALVAGNAGKNLGAVERVATPNVRKIEELEAFFKTGASSFIKSLVYDVLEEAGKKSVLVLIRGDLEINEVKLKNHFGGTDVVLASEGTVQKVTGAPVGFAGPIGLPADTEIHADLSLKGLEEAFTGGNAVDVHLTHVSMSRDVKVTRWGSFYTARAGQPAPGGAGNLEMFRGIEVGHIFKLGPKYTKAFGHTVLGPDNGPITPTMGCYGIGVNRTLAAVIEQNHDDKGLCLPPAVAPFTVALLSMNVRDAAILKYSEDLYLELQGAGIDVLWDDRDERPGFKFKDAELLGMPIQLVVGAKGIAAGEVEWSERKSGQKKTVARGEVVSAVKTALQTMG